MTDGNMAKSLCKKIMRDVSGDLEQNSLLRKGVKEFRMSRKMRNSNKDTSTS
jgi:hypothetical protein